MSSIPISKIDPASCLAFSSLVFPRLRSVNFLVAATKSSTVVTLTSKGVSKLSLRFSIWRPTLAKSYLLESRNKRLIKASAFTRSGGSPGRSFLYISLSASSLFLVVSFLRQRMIAPSSTEVSIARS